MTAAASPPRRALLAGAIAAASTESPARHLGKRFPREVLAFYYPWFGGPENHFRHWLGAHQQGGVPDNPLAGFYDSNEPHVIENHIDLAIKSGITGFISSWWGRGSYEDVALSRILDVASRKNFSISIYIEKFSGNSREQSLSDLKHLLELTRRYKCFLRIDSRPVLFVYRQAIHDHGLSRWLEILKLIRLQEGRAAPLFIADVDPRIHDIARYEAFDGLHIYQIVRELIALTKYGASGPRDAFQRIYSLGGLRCATVMPGFDDRLVPGRGGASSRPVLPRNGVSTFQLSWRTALATMPDWVLVTSWNEWHEASQIEPSVQWRGEHLVTNRQFASEFLG